MWPSRKESHQLNRTSLVHLKPLQRFMIGSEMSEYLCIQPTDNQRMKSWCFVRPQSLAFSRNFWQDHWVIVVHVHGQCGRSVVVAHFLLFSLLRAAEGTQWPLKVILCNCTYSYNVIYHIECINVLTLHWKVIVHNHLVLTYKAKNVQSATK